MFSVYAIVSQKTGKIYIGQTFDLKIRIRQHNSGDDEHLGKFTRDNKGPWTVVYSEVCQTRQDALRREKQLKSFRGREFIRSIINKTRP